MQGDMNSSPGGECLSEIDNCSTQPTTTQNKTKHIEIFLINHR